MNINLIKLNSPDKKEHKLTGFLM